MKEKRKTICILGFVMIVIVTAILIVWLHNNDEDSPKVNFADVEMENLIVHEACHDGYIEDNEEFRKEHLDMIEDLNIGYTGYYSTLSDITLCKNLKELYIGDVNAGDRFYKRTQDIPKPEKKERMVQIQEELEDILQTCKELETLYVWNEKGTCELDNLKFLDGGENLKRIFLTDQKSIDYSPIFDCTELVMLFLDECDISDLEGIGGLEKLEYLDIEGTNIAEADDIIKIPNLKTLVVAGTPLAENEEELALIRETFPDIEIDMN